ncbi:MAG: hypothetical protein ACI89L_000710 [Phycisphaerales bacterium]|jgi:hypothetical protein
MIHPLSLCARVLFGVAAPMLGMAQPAIAQGNPIELRLLSPTLQSESVRARTLSTAGVVVLDELDIPRLRGWDQILVARRDGVEGLTSQIAQVPGPDLVGWAVLADGQRHRVWPTPPASADPDVLDVTLADGTEWGIPLESLRALIFWSDPADTVSDIDDTVRLANGDAVTGFIESIGDTVIVDSTRVPLDRVASITLANPSEPATVMLVDLADGSVVGARSISPTDHGRLSIELQLTGHNPQTSSPRLVVDREDLRAIRPVNQTASLLPMAALSLRSYAPLGGRRWTPPPSASTRRAPAGLRWIDFPGPMEAVYDLPAGATWFCADATVAFGEWSEVSVELLIERPGGERESLATVNLDHGSATDTLRARLPDDAVRLVIRIDAGERGPVQDRVLLRSAALVIEN